MSPILLLSTLPVPFLHVWLPSGIAAQFWRAMKQCHKLLSGNSYIMPVPLVTPQAPSATYRQCQITTCAMRYVHIAQSAKCRQCHQLYTPSMSSALHCHQLCMNCQCHQLYTNCTGTISCILTVSSTVHCMCRKLCFDGVVNNITPVPSAMYY